MTAAAWSPRGRRDRGRARAAPGRSELVLADAARGLGERVLFTGPGRFGAPAWSPDASRLLLPWPDADQWLFLRPAGAGRLAAVANIADQFGPGPPAPRVPARGAVVLLSRSRAATTGGVKRLALVLAVLAAASAATRGAGRRARAADRQRHRPHRAPTARRSPLKPTIRVWCGPWDDDVRTPSIHVRAGSRGALWTLSAVLADVKRKPVVRFPHSFVFDKPTGAQLFAADGRNEASTAEEESSGRITFTKARCGRTTLDVRFKVDAVMGSEFSDGTPVRIRGSFSARG